MQSPSQSQSLQSRQCTFIFSDARRCRQLRASTHPNLCHYHASLEKQAQLTNQLADELAQLFSNPQLSTRDLATALARLIPAVLRGEIQPRNARTVAYLIQTLLQTLRFAQLDRLHALFPPAGPDCDQSVGSAAPAHPERSEASRRHPAISRVALEANIPNQPYSSVDATESAPGNLAAIPASRANRTTSTRGQVHSPQASQSCRPQSAVAVVGSSFRGRPRNLPPLL